MERNQENIILKERNPFLNLEFDGTHQLSKMTVFLYHGNILQHNNTKYQRDNVYENEQDDAWNFLAPDELGKQSPQAVVQDDNGYQSENKQDLKNQKSSVYQKQLLKEYDNILFEAKMSFGLWVLSIIICFVLIFIIIYLLINEKYIQGICSAVLDCFVLAIQQLFKIREDHYRKMVEQKIEHLKNIDYLEYFYEKNKDIDNNIEKRNAEVIKLSDKINKYTNNHENEP